MTIILALISAALMSSADMRALDAAIDSCNRDAALPVFTDEMRRRSAAATAAYEEQERISTERADLAARRLQVDLASEDGAKKDAAATQARSQRDLSRAQQALDDRQRALDDLRRLEAMRREAIDLKRQYFLLRCPAGKKER